MSLGGEDEQEGRPAAAKQKDGLENQKLGLENQKMGLEENEERDAH